MVGAGEAESLRARAVSHRFGGLEVLRKVDVALTPGITALVGVTGAGKSTLMSAMSGGMRPTGGNALLGGLDLYRMRDRIAALPRVALMPQTPSFPGNLTASEVVTYLVWMLGTSARRAPMRARDALDAVGLSARSGSKLRELSGGMVRRVALAQAIGSRPDYLLLDEPSTGLDPQQRRAMIDILEQIGGAVLLSSHVMEDVADLAARVVVMDAGSIRFDGMAEDLAALAPDDTPARRRLEAGFLSILLASSDP